MPSYTGRAADQRNVRQIDYVQGKVELGLEGTGYQHESCHAEEVRGWKGEGGV